MAKRSRKATLFDLHVFMNDRGDIEIETSRVDPDEFVEIVDREMPYYEATHSVSSLIRFLNEMGDEIRERARRYV